MGLYKLKESSGPFRMPVGPHRMKVDGEVREFSPGDTVESDSPLDEIFLEKFDRVDGRTKGAEASEGSIVSLRAKNKLTQGDNPKADPLRSQGKVKTPKQKAAENPSEDEEDEDEKNGLNSPEEEEEEEEDHGGEDEQVEGEKGHDVTAHYPRAAGKGVKVFKTAGGEYYTVDEDDENGADGEHQNDFKDKDALKEFFATKPKGKAKKSVVSRTKKKSK